MFRKIVKVQIKGKKNNSNKLQKKFFNVGAFEPNVAIRKERRNFKKKKKIIRCITPTNEPVSSIKNLRFVLCIYYFFVTFDNE